MKKFVKKQIRKLIQKFHKHSTSIMVGATIGSLGTLASITLFFKNVFSKANLKDNIEDQMDFVSREAQKFENDINNFINTIISKITKFFGK